MTVIDGSSNATNTISAGRLPVAIAVNVVTNKAYVDNNAGSVTIIDGATDAPTTYPAPPDGVAIAVNPVTNKVYGANDSVLVIIDGATDVITSKDMPFRSGTIAVNPLTDQIYVAGSGNLPQNPQISAWVVDGATQDVTPLSIPNGTNIMGVNPATNRIYLAGTGSTDITVLDGASNRPVSIAVGGFASSVVNPVTNRIYGLNSRAHSVNVIDGATNSAVVEVALPDQPLAAALNPRTNKIYVLLANNTVTTIDGVANTTSTAPVGNVGGAAVVGPQSIAIDIVTNHIYVVNHDSQNVTVIDGATNATSTIGVGLSPSVVAVNNVTGRVYVANGDGTVTVIDGNGGALLATANSGSQSNGVAVNPTTNQIYISNSGTNDFTVLDGATNGTYNIPLGGPPAAIAVDTATNRVFAAVPSIGVVVADPINRSTLAIPTVGKLPSSLVVNQSTHKVYATDYPSSTLAIVDGLTGAVSSVIVGTAPSSVSINLATSNVYVVSNQGLSVVRDTPLDAVPLTATAVIPNQATTVPKFAATAASGFGTSVQRVYFQVDDVVGQWRIAALAAGQFTINAAPQLPGMHLLYTFATDGQESTSVNTGAQSAPLIGSVSVQPFFVVPAGTPDLLSVAISPGTGPLVVGFPTQMIALGTFSDGSQRNISAEVSWTTSNPAVAMPDASGVVTATTTGTATLTASIDGLVVAAPVTVAPLKSSIIAVPAGPVTTSGGDYVLILRIANTGTVPAAPIGINSIRLNTAASISLIPGISMMAPGESVTFPFTFPRTAGVPGSGALLRVSGVYTSILPGGVSQSETYTTTSRIRLP